VHRTGKPVHAIRRKMTCRFQGEATRFQEATSSNPASVLIVTRKQQPVRWQIRINGGPDIHFSTTVMLGIIPVD
jgi:hypothetical protein